MWVPAHLSPVAKGHCCLEQGKVGTMKHDLEKEAEGTGLADQDSW